MDKRQTYVFDMYVKNNQQNKHFFLLSILNFELFL